jgi:hypothetical protein
MDIGLTGNQLSTVKIYTEYVKPLFDTGTFGTQLGDLFISIDGYTSGESTTNTWLTGEKWEYAFVFDNHLTKSNSGTIKLYKVVYGANGNILLTNDFKQPNRGVYRDLQETRINMKCTDELLGSIGSWTIDSTNGIITFNINDNVWLRGIDFGFLLECYLR